MKIPCLLTATLALFLVFLGLQYCAQPGSMVRAAGPRDENNRVTFCSDIAPILQRSCQECHRPEGVAPMSLLTYDDVRPWAREIQEKVVKKIMPPYYAAGKIGRFVGDPRLTDEEISKISAWADSGAPRGDPSKLPPPRQWSSSPWQGGVPDLILQMPQPFTIKPDMQDGYAFFVMDYIFDSDAWIRGIEVSPGNRSAVHHANVYMVPSSLKTPAGGRIDNVFDPVTLGARFVTAWEPGCTPLVHPEGVGTLVKKGTRFAILMHYSPSDKPLTDQTSVGFYFADGTVRKEARVLYGGTRNIDLPPRVSNYEIVETRQFREDSLVRAFTCHMHLRGKSFAVRFRYPDGRVETAFEVPHYDVNWQRLYVLEAPIFVPRKTVVEYVATWDNSPSNPSNPDPSKNVKWGDRAIDEMMDGYVNYVSVPEDLNIQVKSGRVVRESDKLAAAIPRELKLALAAFGRAPGDPARPAADRAVPDRVPTAPARSTASPADLAKGPGRSTAVSAVTGARVSPNIAPNISPNIAKPGKRRYLAPASIAVLILLVSAAWYSVARRKRIGRIAV